MLAVKRGASRARPFASWRIVVWLVMLLAAGGFVVNAYAAVVMAGAIGSLKGELPPGVTDPRIQLAWAIASSLLAFATMAVSLSTLRWMGWARDAMRVLALVLAVLAIYTGYVMYAQWQQVGALLAQPGLPEQILAGLARQRTIMLVALILKVVSVPVLAWLFWVLGTPRVRRQFAPSAL